MKKILAFAGSNHSSSVNKQLIKYSESTIKDFEVINILLEEYDAPMFGLDLEKQDGVPESIKNLRKLFLNADGFLISSPEHNGSMPAFFKNIMDWISRVDDAPIFNKKPVLIMSTSPGARGGAGNLENLTKIRPYWGASSVDSFSLPSFFKNFDSEEVKIIDGDLNSQFLSTLNKYFQKI